MVNMDSLRETQVRRRKTLKKGSNHDQGLQIRILIRVRITISYNEFLKIMYEKKINLIT